MVILFVIESKPGKGQKKNDKGRFVALFIFL